MPIVFLAFTAAASDVCKTVNDNNCFPRAKQANIFF